MDWWERTLHIDMAKQRIVAFGSAKIGKPFEAPERRPRIVSPFRSAAFVRVMIPPQRRDRWFKSSPRNHPFQTAVVYRVTRPKTATQLASSSDQVFADRTKNSSYRIGIDRRGKRARTAFMHVSREIGPRNRSLSYAVKGGSNSSSSSTNR